MSHRRAQHTSFELICEKNGIDSPCYSVDEDMVGALFLAPPPLESQIVTQQLSRDGVPVFRRQRDLRPIRLDSASRFAAEYSGIPDTGPLPSPTCIRGVFSTLEITPPSHLAHEAARWLPLQRSAKTQRTDIRVPPIQSLD